MPSTRLNPPAADRSRPRYGWPVSPTRDGRVARRSPSGSGPFTSRSPEGETDDALTPTDAGGYATPRVVRKDPRVLRRRRPPTRGALSYEPRVPHRRPAPSVLLVLDERQEGRSHDGHHRVVRDPVPVRADTAPALADAPVRAPRAVDAVAHRAQPRRGAADPRAGADPRLPRVLDDDLRRRPAAARRRADPDRRHRQWPDAAAHSRQGRPRSLCAAAGAAPPATARLLVHPSVARVALPSPDTPRASAQPGAPRRARHAQQSAECLSSRVAEERDSQTGQCAHAPTFVRDPPP